MQFSRSFLALVLALTMFVTGCQNSAGEVKQPSSTLAQPVINKVTVTPIETRLSPSKTSIESTPQASESQVELSPKVEAVTTWPVREAGIETPIAGQELLFTLVKRVSESYQNMGVYRLDLMSGESNQILGEGFQLQAISPDGNWILSNQGMNLFVSQRDGSNPVLVSNRFSEQSSTPVIWLKDGSSVLWLEQVTDHKQLMTADPQTGTMVLAADIFQDQPALILSSPMLEKIAWVNGTCNSGNYCRGELFLSPLDGTKMTSWGAVTNPAMDTSMTQLAYIEQGEDEVLLIIRLGGSAMENLPLDMGGDIPVDYEWSPDGKTLIAIGQIRSDYSGRNYGNKIIAFRAPDWKPEILGELEGLNARMTFSADGKTVVVSATKPLDSGGYEVVVSILDLADGKMRIVDLGMNTQMEEYIFIPKIWE
ncbi:MAG: hypothetical protein ACYDH1_02115 [Anaerolineaceae bacterium]